MTLTFRTRSGSGRRPESGLIYPNPSVVPNSENWQRKANGHLSFSHTSLRSSHLHSVSFCSKFYCCCYTPHDQNALSVGRSRATSVSRNSATVVQNIDASDSDWDSRSSGSVSTTTVRQTEEEAELTSSDWLPPDCLPSLLSGRYGLLVVILLSAVYLVLYCSSDMFCSLCLVYNTALKQGLQVKSIGVSKVRAIVLD